MTGQQEAATDAGLPQPPKHALRFRGAVYPVLLPSWRDPRLRVSMTFVLLYVLGFTAFQFRLSFPQIAAAVLTCALIELALTFHQKRAIVWPASAMLTGNGIAFIMRIPTVQHGQWWSFEGVWIYAGTGALAMASKYLIKFRRRHVFNPSNVALVIVFLALGSSRVEPLQFWWGPLSPALVAVLAVIVIGALVVLSQVGLLAVAALFWITFAAALGVLALSGHAFSANWHLGPVADGYFWKVLVTSPEVFIFLAFMITDPRTAPETRGGRRIYAVAIGLLGALLIAPMQSEFAAKVALLASLTIVCAARPLPILAREALGRRSAARPAASTALRRRPVLGAVGVAGLAAFAGLIVIAGSPARSVPTLSSATLSSSVPVTIVHTPGVVSINRATGRQIAADAIDDLRLVTLALGRRDVTAAASAGSSLYLGALKTRISKAAGKSLVVPSYAVDAVRIQLRRAVGQAPPTIVATLSGLVTPLTYPAGSTTARSGRTIPFAQDFALGIDGPRFVLLEGTSTAPPAAPLAAGPGKANLSHGVGAFRQIHLVNVAPKLGLDFRQGAFRFSMTYDQQAMMGGGVCWLDYNDDGWLDLFAVNSYEDADQPEWDSRGGLPQSELFENVHGHFVNVTRSSGAGIRVKGNGCAAADLNGDGYPDLVVTTATGVEILWNNGNGTFTPEVLPARYGWYSGVAVADVNGDGRPDIFVAGYTNLDNPITSSIAGFPTNYQGVRDLLYLNEGPGKNGWDRFREVGREAGLEKAGDARHGLGVTFTDVNGDGRPDLYVANDEDPSYLYLDEPGGPLGFHFVDAAKAYGVANGAAGMGVAVGDYNGDGRPDLFVTNSRGQPHAAYQSKVLANGETVYLPEVGKFAKALDRKQTVGWGDAWVDFQNTGDPDLIIANGAIPVTNLKRDTEPVQVLQGLGGGRFANASGIVSSKGMPKIIGRGLAAADFDNDGRMAVAINSIGGPLVLLEDTGPVGNWLEVSLKGFQADALVTATLANGRKLVQELHDGSSYLSSEDPRAHFGLGRQTKVAKLTIRWPNGKLTRLSNLRANRIVAVAPPR
jgi:hypothetical protein